MADNLSNFDRRKAYLHERMMNADVKIIPLDGSYSPAKDSRSVRYVPIPEYGIALLQVLEPVPQSFETTPDEYL